MDSSRDAKELSVLGTKFSVHHLLAFGSSAAQNVNVDAARHTNLAAQQRLVVACPRRATRYATRVTSKYVRGFSAASDSSNDGIKGSRAGSSFDTASSTTTATGSVVRFC